MGFFGLLTAALGLSADAFTVALCKGLGLRRYDPRFALTVAAFFGSFQALMPVVGWLLGSLLDPFIFTLERPAACLLLLIVGGKMIFDALSNDTTVTLSPVPDYRELTMLAAATSIDALAVGMTFAFIGVSVIPAAALIGTVTFLLSLLGVYAGFRIGGRFDGRLSALGGIVLTALAIRIFFTR